jgi:hypothetical protein
MKLRNRVEGEVEHFQREFAADDNHGTLDANPAAIARDRLDHAAGDLFLVGHRLVHDRIEDRDDLTRHVNGVGHVDVATQRSAHALGQHRLAVSRRSVEEHRFPCVHRRSKLVEDPVVDDEVSEAGAETIAIDVPARGHHRLDVLNVGVERNRSRADVLISVEVLAGAVPSEIGERVPVAGRARPGGAAHFDEPLGAHAFDQRFEQRIRQPHAIGDGDTCRLAGIQRFQEQLADLVDGEAGLFDRDGPTGRGRGRRRRTGLRAFSDGGLHQWCPFSASGPSTAMNLSAAGPIVTTHTAGKMQMTSGKTILTPVLAAASSAR